MKKILIFAIFVFCTSISNALSSPQPKFEQSKKAFTIKYSSQANYVESYCLSHGYEILDAIFNVYDQGQAWCLEVQTTGQGLTDCFAFFNNAYQEQTTAMYEWIQYCEECYCYSDYPNN